MQGWGGGGGAKFFDEGLGQVFSPLGFHEHWPESWQLGKPGRGQGSRRQQGQGVCMLATVFRGTAQSLRSSDLPLKGFTGIQQTTKDQAWRPLHIVSLALDDVHLLTEEDGWWAVCLGAAGIYRVNKAAFIVGIVFSGYNTVWICTD